MKRSNPAGKVGEATTSRSPFRSAEGAGSSRIKDVAHSGNILDLVRKIAEYRLCAPMVAILTGITTRKHDI